MNRLMKRVALACFLLMFVTPLAFLPLAEGNWTQTEDCTGNDLNDAWASSCSNAYFVGNRGTIAHYDGSTCSEEDSGTTSYLQGIWGRSASDIYAVGYNGYITHFDGTNWSAMNSGTTNQLNAVWGCQNGVFAVGEKGTILYYNGSTWQQMASNMTRTLYGVWGSSCNDVFAVGAVDSFNYQGKPFTCSATLHYDGNDDYRWDPLENKQNVTLQDIWGCGECNAFAVSDDGTLINYDCTYDEVRESWWKNVEKNISFAQTGMSCGISGYTCNDIFVVGRGHSFDCRGDSDDCDGIIALEDQLLADVFCVEDNNICCWAVGGSGASFAETITSTSSTTSTSTTTTTCNNPLCCSEQVYGEDSENTKLLRQFRDEVLKSTPEGQEMIRLYYELSPIIVKAMEEDESFKKSIKETLDEIMPIIRGLVD